MPQPAVRTTTAFGASIAPMSAASPPRALGRYVLFEEEVGAGGMATLHLGRLVGDAGFARTVAIKRLRPVYAHDREFLAMFLDEARVAARIRHPNVAATIDLVRDRDEVLLVLEYVHGEALDQLLRAEEALGETPDLAIVGAVVCGALHGLHAAHEACDERGAPLNIVHRDVSPHNVLVGDDGLARVVDFGIARAAGRLAQTRTGQLKGKLSYMTPEQIGIDGPGATAPLERDATGKATLDRRADVFAAGIVLWEALTGRRLFAGPGGDLAILERVQTLAIAPPSRFAKGVPEALDEVALRALERDRSKRWPTALAMALALESALPRGIASPYRVGQWVRRLAGRKLAEREEFLRLVESRLPSSVETEGRVSLVIRAALEPPARRADGEGAPRPSEPPPVAEPRPFAMVADDTHTGDGVDDDITVPGGSLGLADDGPAAKAGTFDPPTLTEVMPRPAPMGAAAPTFPSSEGEWTTIRVSRDEAREAAATAKPGAPLSRAESLVYWTSAPKGRTLLAAALIGALVTLVVMGSLWIALRD